MRKLSASLLILAILCSCGFPAESSISVDVNNPIGPVKRFLLGHNVASADPRGIFTDDFDAKTFDKQYIRNAEGFWDPVQQKPCMPVVNEAKATGISMLRYPGGCFASNFDWRKSVGPLSERGDWRFGLDEYIELCRTLGAEPLITASDYVLPADEMPRHLAEMVEYLNAPATPEHPWAMKRQEWGHSQPYGVKYIELGNESEAGNYYCKPRRKFTPEDYAEYAIACAAAMRAVDPTLKIGIQYCRGKAAKAFSQADFIIVHHYGAKINAQIIENDFKSAMAHVEHYQRELNSIAQDVLTLTGKSIPLALTEYNIYFFGNEPKPYRYSAMAGLFCADILRSLMESDSPVEIANYWHISNGYFGMIGSKNCAVTTRRATLAFYQLWGAHTGATVLPVQCNNIPQLSAPACEDTPAATGNVHVPEEKLSSVLLPPLQFELLESSGIKGATDGNGNLTFEINALKAPVYLKFGSIPNALSGSANLYKMSFQARYRTESVGVPTGNLGLSLLDTRGWNATHSAVAIDGLEMHRDWKDLSVTFQPRPDCKSIDLVFRAPNIASPLTGTLEIRGFAIEIWRPAISPAYQAITACSTLSTDGQTLHLLVFNKSFDKEIDSTIDLKGFKASKSISWTAQSAPEVIEYTEPVRGEIALPASGEMLRYRFPAHSMTAIDFLR